MTMRMLAAVAGLLLACGTLNAAEIKLLAAGALKEIVLDVLSQFEQSSGHKVAATWSSTVKIKSQIAEGGVYDLVLVGAPEIDAFIKDGKVAPGSRLDLVRSGVGVAVKAGAPRPDIGSADAVKKALLAAHSVAYSTGPSGVYVQKLFEKLGIADQMKPKATQTPPGKRVGEFLANGEAELGFQQVSELIHEHGIDFLGPLPAEIQNITIYSSGIPTTAKETAAGKAMQSFLASSNASAAIRKYGMEPMK